MRSVIKSCILNVRTNDRYGLGTCYLRASKIRRAEYHFRKAMEIHPNNAVVLGCVAMVSADIVILAVGFGDNANGSGDELHVFLSFFIHRRWNGASSWIQR